jgi:hypothetical protein
MILFGNILGKDYCNETCEMEYDNKMLDKYPDFDKRGDLGHCYHCGSNELTITNELKFIRPAGNILEGTQAHTNFTDQYYHCNSCHKNSRTFLMGKPIKSNDVKTHKTGFNFIKFEISDFLKKECEKWYVDYTGNMVFIQNWFLLIFGARANDFICSLCQKRYYHDSLCNASGLDKDPYANCDCREKIDPEQLEQQNDIPVSIYIDKGEFGALELHIECAKGVGLMPH